MSDAPSISQEHQGGAATPAAQLLAELLDFSTPKTEREHFAGRKIADLQEQITVLRARVPRAYVLSRKAEWLRLFREVEGYLRVCHNKHGTDWEGRDHARAALRAAQEDLSAALEEENETARHIKPPSNETEGGEL